MRRLLQSTCLLFAILLFAGRIMADVATTPASDPKETNDIKETPTPAYLQSEPAPAAPATVIAGLRTWLDLYEAEANHPWPAFPEDTLLKPGMTDPLVVDLRQRLRETGDLAGWDSTSDQFDAPLKQAVKNFQQRMGLAADGVVGAGTLRELNVPPLDRAKQLAVNLVRWTELGQKLGDRFVLVNVPDFHLFVYDHGQKVLDMKAIVGKRTRQTPEITSSITHIIFNPWWSVPQLIARRDIIPKILDDPDYLDRMHIRIFESQENNAAQIPENRVNWNQVADNGFPWYFRQDPGAQNALGKVKFEFQNSASIYMHDTPTRDLFKQPVRLFSSGCIRLEKPLALVEELMKTDSAFDEERLQSLLDRQKTVFIHVKTPTPVFIAYLTAWIDDRGRLNFRDDVYGRDDPDAPAIHQDGDPEPEEDDGDGNLDSQQE